MPISSMTGFARAEGSWQDYAWTWELKSVNNRGLDVRMRLPNGMDALEAPVRAALAERFSRGSINCAIQMSKAGQNGAVSVNEAALGQIIQTATEAAKQHGLEPPRIEGLLALKGVMEVGEPEEDKAALKAKADAVLESFFEAADGLIETRRAEGERLRQVMAGQVSELGNLLMQAEGSAGRQPEAIQARLEAQLDELLAAREQKPDPDRLAQEVAFLAIKADVREELDRLAGHIEAAEGLLGEDRAVGRELDFLAQEFGREANTLCSKAGDQELSRIGLAMKTVVDQIREQSQNIE